MTSPEVLLSRFMAFSSVGVLATAQELAGAVLSATPGANPQQVAEETMLLVSTTSARASQVGWKDQPAIRDAAVVAIAELPFLHRDYLVGSMILSEAPEGDVAADEDALNELARRQSFYEAHFPQDTFPGRRMLTDKMELWLGRVSTPGLGEKPSERLVSLGLVDPLYHHLQLVMGFARQATSA